MKSLSVVTAILAGLVLPASAANAGQAIPVGRAIAEATRAATVEPTPGGFMNANQLYVWSEGAVYRLYAAPGSITDIALQPGEELVSVAAGDTARWIIGDTTSGSGEGTRSHILVKPVAAGLSTNLVITTSRRAYHLSLLSVAGAAMAALSWRYPHDDLVARKRAAIAAEAKQPVAAGLDIERLYFGYAVSGDSPSWRPLRVFDDGRQTFIEFPATIATGEAPPLFAVDAAGKAELINYRMRGRFYVVDRILDRAELRLGTKKQQVVQIRRGGAAGGAS